MICAAPLLNVGVGIFTFWHYIILPYSYLLDQLMRYEGVAISDDDETDYSSGDESGVQLPLAIVTQVQSVSQHQCINLGRLYPPQRK